MANKIKCRNCGHKEKLNAKFIAKVAGIALTGAGGYAWVAYLFAGTGLAMPICAALVFGGALTAAFSDEIGEFLSTRYDCPECGTRDWKVISD